MCHWDTQVMVVENGPLYPYVDTPTDTTISSYNSHLPHEQCLDYISGSFNVFVLEENGAFYLQK